MPKPRDPLKARYMFSDDFKFLQKVVVFHPQEKRILALKRSLQDLQRPGKWDLCGGNVTFGEKHDISLIREVKEETNLEITNPKPIQVVTNFENNIYYLFIGYQAEATTITVKLSKEHTEYLWVSVDEFLKLDSAEFLQKLAQAARNLS